MRKLRAADSVVLGVPPGVSINAGFTAAPPGAPTLLSIAIFGIPLLVLIAVGLFTILALKLLVFIVLPVLAVVWLFRKFSRSGDWPAS